MISSTKCGPFLFGFTGASGSGKTTLLTAVIAQLTSNGLKVGAIKRAFDEFDIDKRGKDSYRLREAGCAEVMVVSKGRVAVLREYIEEAVPTLPELALLFERADIVLVEGIADEVLPTIEVHRPSLGKAPRWPQHRQIMAVASDEVFPCGVPRIDLRDVDGVASLVLRTRQKNEGLRHRRADWVSA